MTTCPHNKTTNCFRHYTNEESSRQLHETPRRGRRRDNHEIDDESRGSLGRSSSDERLKLILISELREAWVRWLSSLALRIGLWVSLSVCRLHFICYFITTALPNLNYTQAIQRCWLAVALSLIPLQSLLPLQPRERYNVWSLIAPAPFEPTTAFKTVYGAL